MRPLRPHLLTAGALILAAGCSPQKTDDPIANNRLDESRFFTEAFQLANLTVWPILAEKLREIGDFLTLSEAQTRGEAVVKELGAPVPVPSSALQTNDAVLNDPGPQVNAVEIENKGDKPILVCAGTLVKGGRQDRQIAQDIVIAPRTTVPVDAFCIEERRWVEQRNGTDTKGVFQPLPVLAAKEVRLHAQYYGDQDGVWRSVQAYNDAAGKAPETDTLLAAVEEVDAKVKARREEMEKAIRAHFEALRARGKPIVGFAYAINGKPVSVRTFAHPKILDGHLQAFAKTMCIEADLAGSAAGEAKCPPAKLEDVVKLVQSIQSTPETIQDTKASNKLGLRRNDAGGNSNCYVPAPKAEGSLMAVTQDWTSAE